eukprot:comp24244_c0_seq1/m.44852 comp24244_c0_seq1/g.44852  ORF comp24244_c0_seq1/g.44852 comp24244_c0_seq1/m.44852 type:complete len:1158 (-) comp24244_c0_seq1:590-4063(-)
MAQLLLQRAFGGYGRMVSRRPAEFIFLSVLTVLIATTPFWDFTFRQQSRPVRLWASPPAPKLHGNVWLQSVTFSSDDIVSKEGFQKIFDFQAQLEDAVVVVDGKGLAVVDVCVKNDGNASEPSTGNVIKCFSKTPLQLWGMNMDSFAQEKDVRAAIRAAGATERELAFGSGVPVGDGEGIKNITITYLLTSEMAASHVWPLALEAALSASSWVKRSQNSGSPTKVYYWEEKIKSSEVLILGVLNTVTVLYVYVTFRKMHRLGSKYVLGVAGLFTMTGSFFVTIGIFNALSVPLTLVVSEVIPFLYILISLENAFMLSKYATYESLRYMRSAKASQDTDVCPDASDFVGSGLAACGPTITVDVLFKLSILMAGSMTGVKVLEQISLFAAVSLVAEYALFLTFFVPVLALKLEHSRLVMQQPSRAATKGPAKGMGSLQHLYSCLAQQQESEPPRDGPEIDTMKVVAIIVLLLFSFTSPMLRNPRASQTQPLPEVLRSHPALQDYSTFSLGGGVSSPLHLQVCATAEECTVRPLTVLDYCHEIVGHEVCTGLEGTVIGAVEAEQAVVMYVVLLSALVVGKYVFLDTVGPLSASAPTTPRGSSGALSKMDEKENKTGSTNGANATADGRKTKGEATENGTHRPTFTMGEENESPSMTPSSSSADMSELPSNATSSTNVDTPAVEDIPTGAPRPLPEIESIFKSEGASKLSDAEVVALVKAGVVPPYNVEKACNDYTRGVRIRRQLVTGEIASNGVSGFNAETMLKLPYIGMDYTEVLGVCCENVLGFIPVPVGTVGPMLLDDVKVTIPMATTEGALLASTHRGCKAITMSGGASSMVVREGMTRAPVARMPSAKRCAEVKAWLEQPENYAAIKEAFESSSRFAKLQSVDAKVAGRQIYIRFVTLTGDAMGMNMISKGTERALSALTLVFPDMEVLALSGNYCTDKKPAAVNWIEGRGKSVVAEAVIKGEVVKKVLKTTVQALVEVNIVKNLIGSAMAGSIGGFNAHAANIVTAVYIATGQDPAQNVESSTCITLMEAINGGQDLHISCTMPSIEVGTVGGGTQLPAQSTCLRMMGIQGPNRDIPGANARRLAQVVCAAVMAGELSLMSALAAGHLVKSHMTHNRSSANLASAAEIAEKEEKFRKLRQQLSQSSLSLAGNKS